jgi:DHA1 family inner membrane transport protein
MSQPTSSKNTTLTLWALLFGNFIIGTGVLLPAGLLNDISADFKQSQAVTADLLFYGGLIVGFGAPILAGLTSRVDRRILLTLSLMVFGLGHVASAFAPMFDMQLVIRALTVVGAAVFTPQAASTVGLLVPTEKRAGAIAFIFIGWSAASVAGIPLGTYLSTYLGWRIVYGAMGLLCLVAASTVRLTLRPKLFVTPLSFAAWKQALTTPLLWVVYLVTLCSMAAQFAMFGYIAPILRDGFGVGVTAISAMFAVVGIAGLLGNTIASRIVGRFGIDTVIAVALALLCFGFFGFGLSWGNLLPAYAAAALWGLGSFSSNSLQQSRLVALAPPLAAATVALNTSVVYLGQSIGTKAGGALLLQDKMKWLPAIALAFMLCALALSILAHYLTRRRVSAL